MTVEPHQESFAMVTAQDLAAICGSPAIGAFLARRLEQRVRFNHTPEGDMAHGLDHLPRAALARIQYALDYLGREEMTMRPERRDQVLRYLEVAGALLMAAHDRISAAPIAGANEQ